MSYKGSEHGVHVGHKGAWKGVSYDFLHDTLGISIHQLRMYEWGVRKPGWTRAVEIEGALRAAKWKHGKITKRQMRSDIPW